MKTLKFAPELVPKIISGQKVSTWRLFDDKDLKTNDDLLFINKETGGQFGSAKIKSLVTKTLGSLTENELAEHSYTSADDMYVDLRKHYGDKINENSWVKILTFDFTP